MNGPDRQTRADPPAGADRPVRTGRSAGPIEPLTPAGLMPTTGRCRPHEGIGASPELTRGAGRARRTAVSEEEGWTCYHRVAWKVRHRRPPTGVTMWGSRSWERGR